MSSNIIYEEEVVDLEKKDRRRRLLDGCLRFLLEISILFILIGIFGYVIIPIYIAIAFFLFSNPIPQVPPSYKITKMGIIFENNDIIWLKKINSISINKKRKYISLKRHLGFEVVRLYSKKTENLFNIIAKLIETRAWEIESKQ